MFLCSSRFTDSKKYEEDFMECFQLSTPRQGEICNACVLLVKRWKKLPAGSDRNWRHVRSIYEYVLYQTYICSIFNLNYLSNLT